MNVPGLPDPSLAPANGPQRKPKAKVSAVKPGAQKGVQALGYIRVSTGEQAESGLGLQAQRDAITAAVAARGWTLAGIHEDAGISGKLVANRPGLTAAMHEMEASEGAITVLVVAKLDRLARSMLGFAEIVARAARNEWRVVPLDFDLDMTTPTGAMVASMLAALAEWERAMIGERTRKALEVRMAQGVKVGRTSTVPLDLHKQIHAARWKMGWSYRRIAKILNDNKQPTPRGGVEWYPGAVRLIAERPLPPKKEEAA